MIHGLAKLLRYGRGHISVYRALRGGIVEVNEGLGNGSGGCFWCILADLDDCWNRGGVVQFGEAAGGDGGAQNECGSEATKLHANEDSAAGVALGQM